MGASTASIGLLPTYSTAGWFSPIALIAIRVFQGLALGGEYGGAAVYLAEHVPDSGAASTPAFMQITAGRVLVISLGVILGTQRCHERRELSTMGMAAAVSSLHRVRQHFALHSHPDERIAHLHPHQVLRNAIC